MKILLQKCYYNKTQLELSALAGMTSASHRSNIQLFFGHPPPLRVVKAILLFLISYLSSYGFERITK